jgi:hypothetical protein
MRPGWVAFWTTAPEDYDWFGTGTAEQCGEWKGKQLRRVVADSQLVLDENGHKVRSKHVAAEALAKCLESIRY